MRTQASPLMADVLAERFGDRGGGGGHEWAPLQESTIRIKEALGVNDPEEPNTRTEEMMRTYLYEHGYQLDPLGATLLIPDMSGIGDSMWKKMWTAAHGWTQGPGEMFPGAYTPPRPIAWLTGTDVTMLMTSLQFHIMETIEMMIGGSPIGGGSYGTANYSLPAVRP